MEIRTFTINGIEHREELIPNGHFMVRIYNPSTVPWDYFGEKQAREWRAVMKKANIPCQVLTIKKQRLHPQGSGPGGRIRFGDAMYPGEWRLVIEKRYHETAENALDEHDKAVTRWLLNRGPRPDTICT